MSVHRVAVGVLLLAAAAASLPGTVAPDALPGTANAAATASLLSPGTANTAATPSPPPVRWGVDGHVMATRAALGNLPRTMPAFFRNAGPQLEYLSPEPDRWRTSEFREMDEAWKYDHYIDLENVPAGALDAPDRFEFIKALLEAGVQRPQQDVGFLPFRILEVYQRLITGFARWRVAPDGPERGWIQERILHDAGILSHYVVDAAQPHHTTIHFNGWAQDAPNPQGFTTDRGFHSRFESAFVRAHIAPGTWSPGWPMPQGSWETSEPPSGSTSRRATPPWSASTSWRRSTGSRPTLRPIPRPGSSRSSAWRKGRRCSGPSGGRPGGRVKGWRPADVAAG
jgi:hypothetical protein